MVDSGNERKSALVKAGQVEIAMKRLRFGQKWSKDEMQDDHVICLPLLRAVK